MVSMITEWISNKSSPSRLVKRLIVMAVDASLCLWTVWFAFYLRLGEFIDIFDTSPFPAVLSVGLVLPIFLVCGLYRSIFRYSGWPALLLIFRALVIYGVLYASIFTVYGVSGVPRTIGIIQPILLFLLVCSSRIFARLMFGDQFGNFINQRSKTRVLIYGAGTSGRQLADAMANNQKMVVVGFLDDDHKLHGHVLNGLLIHDPSKLPFIVKAKDIDDILLAMPSLSRRRRNEVLNAIREHQVSVRTLPSVTDLVQGKVTVSDLRELDIDDLLGREPVAPDKGLLEKNITKRTVMVTGAGGSIGSELCRKIAALGPEKLLLVEQNEFALYQIHQELEFNVSEVTLVPLLANVQDEKRIKEVIYDWKPQTVYHAAAYKHVPIVEQNLAEGIKNNVLGTLRTAHAALANDVENFVLVSTDKAVRPTNIMGASKRLAEIILQALAFESPAVNFSMVRFGNVLGSSGSVVPKFREQIKSGGPVTITDPDITRFFMTIPEAAQLVIQAGALAKGGDVFVLDMGEPVKIIELATRIIEMSGLSVRNGENSDGDIEIKVTGLRPGEKLYEELLIGDNPEKTSHPKIMKAHEEFVSWSQLRSDLINLEGVVETNDVAGICAIIKKLVPDYLPSDKIAESIKQSRLTS